LFAAFSNISKHKDKNQERGACQGLLFQTVLKLSAQDTYKTYNGSEVEVDFTKDTGAGKASAI
jgi:hypothetical protein